MNYKKPKIDIWLALAVFGLAVFGLVMISSASVVASWEKFGHNNYYVAHQAWSLAVGIIIWAIMVNIDYRVWRKYATVMLVITLLLLVGVFIPGISKQLGGAHRWISFGPIFFQPSEIAKLTFILYLAAWLERKGEGVKNFQTGFIPFAAILGFVAFLIIKEPDMGTMSILAVSSIAMFFVAGSSILHLGGLGISVLALGWILIKSAPYRLQRFLTFLNPSENTLGSGYHINQALIGIGSGGLWGLGFGQSKQKYLYLPQAHTDSIFAIIAEEFGFIRTTIVILVFLFVIVRGFIIASKAPDVFSRLAAIGITTWIMFQSFVNIGAMLGVLPLTGLPLPFVSYGGSSLIVLFAAMGILLNISKQCKSD